MKYVNIDKKDNIIETGNQKLDEIGLLEKGVFKVFYTDSLDLHLQRLTNNIILEAVNNGKKVMSLSTFSSFAVGEFHATIQHKTGKSEVSDWFDDKPLFVCEYNDYDNLVSIIKKLEERIDTLGIEVLYLPNLEYSLINCDAESQLEALRFLKEFAFSNQISVIATLSPYYANEYKGIFYAVHKIDAEEFKGVLSMESKHNVVPIDSKTVTIECWDCWDYVADAPKTLMLKSTDEFYTFDSVTSYVNDLENTIPF